METLKAIESIVRASAIIIGGFWAYYRFFNGRILTPRLDLQISSTDFIQDKQVYLIVKLDFINVGSTRVNFLQRGTALIISAYDPIKKIDDLISIEQEHLATFEVLKKHKYIEPGRTIHEEKIFVIPNNIFPALKLECRVVHKNTNQLQKNISNTISSVVTLKNTLLSEDNDDADD